MPRARKTFPWNRCEGQLLEWAVDLENSSTQSRSLGALITLRCSSESCVGLAQPRPMPRAVSCSARLPYCPAWVSVVGVRMKRRDPSSVLTLPLRFNLALYFGPTYNRILASKVFKGGSASSPDQYPLKALPSHAQPRFRQQTGCSVRGSSHIFQAQLE